MVGSLESAPNPARRSHDNAQIRLIMSVTAVSWSRCVRGRLIEIEF